MIDGLLKKNKKHNYPVWPYHNLFLCVHAKAVINKWYGYLKYKARAEYDIMTALLLL